MILVKKIVIENFIFFFEFCGKEKIKSCIVFKINIGERYYIKVFGICFIWSFNFNILKFFLLMRLMCMEILVLVIFYFLLFIYIFVLKVNDLGFRFKFEFKYLEI